MQCPQTTHGFLRRLFSLSSPCATGEKTNRIVALEELSVLSDTGTKPQSKTWHHDRAWWNVVVRESGGTWIFRLDDRSWTPVLKLASGANRADVLPLGDVTHILLENGSSSKMASVEYVPGSPGSYRLWTDRPGLSSVPLDGSAKTATVAMDSIGRLWIASDTRATVEVRYSDFPYATWSAPLTVASGICTNDISAITSLGNGMIGVLWSDQSTERFGFRLHVDATDPDVWTDDEVPASDSALDVGSGMADDHINLAVAADGTLYAAVKTGYNNRSCPKIALLVRRPSGTWGPLYLVDTKGTRPIVAIGESQQRIVVVYRSTDSRGPIVYRESPMGSIAFGPRETLIDDVALNNPSSTKQKFTNELVVIASGNGQLGGALLRISGGSNSVARVNAEAAY